MKTFFLIELQKSTVIKPSTCMPGVWGCSDLSSDLAARCEWSGLLLSGACSGQWSSFRTHLLCAGATLGVKGRHDGEHHLLPLEGQGWHSFPPAPWDAMLVLGCCLNQHGEKGNFRDFHLPLISHRSRTLCGAAPTAKYFNPTCTCEDTGNDHQVDPL
jgi:hypothetical protein